MRHASMEAAHRACLTLEFPAPKDTHSHAKDEHCTNNGIQGTGRRKAVHARWGKARGVQGHAVGLLKRARRRR